MAIAYYASRISDNILRTPSVQRDGVEIPGWLICKDVVIARTGFQTYLIKELPQERAAELGIDLSNPLATIDLYRDASEVFSPETVASFETVSVTDNHPKDFVAPDNWKKVANGHAQNLRKGWEALESGEWPLIADLAITTEPLISEVEADRKREISCGYSYDIARHGDVIWQVKIRGNHVAVVDRGRAGAEVCIADALPVEVAEQVAKHPEAESSTSKKEKPKVKITDKLKHVFGLGLKQMATDASPEEMAEAAGEFHKLTGQARDESEEEVKKREEMAADRKRADDKKAAEDKVAADKIAADKKAKDEAEAEAEAKRKAEEEGKDSQEDVHRVAASIGDHRCKDCMGAENKCHDCMMHDRLDDVLEAKKEAGGDGMEDLKEMVGAHNGAGEESQDDMPGNEASEVIEPVGEEASMANDAAATLLPVIEKSPDKRMLQRAFDAAPLDDPFEFMKAMRPAAAKTTDKKFRRAFDAQLKKFTRTSKPGQGGYDLVGAAALARDAARITDAARQGGGAGPKIADNTKIQAIYDAARTGKPVVKS